MLAFRLGWGPWRAFLIRVRCALAPFEPHPGKRVRPADSTERSQPRSPGRQALNEPTGQTLTTPRKLRTAHQQCQSGTHRLNLHASTADQSTVTNMTRSPRWRHTVTVVCAGLLVALVVGCSPPGTRGKARGGSRATALQNRTPARAAKGSAPTTVSTTVVRAPAPTTASRQPSPPPFAAPQAAPPAAESGATPSITGVTVTVYYTAVESFHTGARRSVQGCLVRDCSFGNATLGSYPKDFVAKVEQEGTGRMTSGAHAGRYLNWSYDVGYWLDDIPSDSYGNRLVPFVSAAADDLARGTRFQLVAPLRLEDGSRLDADAERRLTAASFVVEDEFTPGLGGARHVDVYIGEEDRAGFEDSSPLYKMLVGVGLALR